MKDIIISKLNKAYEGTAVLKDFSTRISGNGITCIMGPSGCGKTTLMNILLGLEKADSGEISGLPDRVSAVFQEDRLCEDFSASANIRMACSRSLPDEEIQKWLDHLEIPEILHKKTSELSGGMKRRVAIARAMLAEGDMIFMDEPFKGLDDETRKAVIREVKACGKPLLIITHDPEDAELLGANIIYFNT
ncbi:MAG: ATP-binding cassette domain-containing protein [Eubacteriales bacterium]|nr:ATP-binding cassette domain-containing protein [Eubacteriales bacterium]